MLNLIQAAEHYRALGYSIVPVDHQKKSLLCWSRYQTRRMTTFQIRRWFSDPRCDGIAVLGGPISGNLEMIDIDAKNDLTGLLMKAFGGSLRAQHPHILEKLVIAATRNAGYHFFYKTPAVGRCMVLAQRPTTDLERLAHPHVLVKVLIEIRATGGYGIVHPTSGYRFLRGNLQTVQLLSPEDRTTMLDLARTFNTLPQPVPVIYPAFQRLRSAESPLDDFDERGDLRQLLTSYGWIYVRTNGERSYYRRPGETDHDTSGNYHHRLGFFSVFSTSTEFIRRQPYRPSAVYAVLACQGDFHLAARQLVLAGFGIPYRLR